MKELNGLGANGTFKPVPFSVVPEATRVFGTSFVDELKKADLGVFLKTRLVAQNYWNQDSSAIPTKAATVQRFSQRLILSLAASRTEWSPFLRDISQAYTKSSTPL